MGLAVPDMTTMVGLTGSVAFSAVGFVLPGAFYLKLRPEHPPERGSLCAPSKALVHTAAAWVMVIIGCVGAVLGVVSTLQPKN